MTGKLVLEYDPDDPTEAARVAAIVRGDGEQLRSVLFKLFNALRDIEHGRATGLGGATLTEVPARLLADWIFGELEARGLSLEE